MQLLFFSAQYFAAVIIILALSTAITVIILNIHCRGAHKIDVPRWMRILVLHWFARIVCMQSFVDANMEKNAVCFKIVLVFVSINLYIHDVTLNVVAYASIINNINVMKL